MPTLIMFSGSESILITDIFKSLSWMQYSSTQSHFLPLSSLSLFTLKRRGLLSEQKGFFMFSFCWVMSRNSCVALGESCKDFYIHVVQWATWQMPWNHDFVTNNLFFYLLNIFMQYHWGEKKEEILQIKKALFSPRRSPSSVSPLACGDSKCFQCLSAFTIWYSASNDDGKCCENAVGNRHLRSGWYSSHCLYLLTLGSRILPYIFWGFFYFYSVITYIS